MVILFSANISITHQERLKKDHPKHSFVFCESVDVAKNHLDQADILVTYGSGWTSELIGQAIKLKWIMVLSAGVDRLPLEAIEKRGIILTNARGVHKTPMAEYAISMLLQVYRQEKVQIENERNKKWDKSHTMEELSGKSLLVAGTGAIGQEVARLAKAFGMQTYGLSRSGDEIEYFDQNIQASDLNTILPKVDIVVSVLPQTEETNEVFASEQFKIMRSNAILLNMGRGNSVNSDDLLQAIQKGYISHAILDVFEEEPLPENHPFWTEKNVTITPHLSSSTKHYEDRALAIFEQNLHTYEDERDCYVNKVDLTRGY